MIEIEPERLIVTNGQSAVDAMRRSGIKGRILSWDDVLHDGPVPGQMTHQDLAARRAEFLADGADPAPILDDLLRRDQILREASGQIVLWFEHDLYDQLQLIQIIDRLQARPDVLLVPEHTFIAQRSWEDLPTVLKTAVVLTEAQQLIAASAWEAFSMDGPETMVAAMTEPSADALPHLAPAMIRWLESFPDGAGLSKTERDVLELLALQPRSGLDLFRRTNQMEAAAFRGDWSFWKLLEGMRPQLITLDGPSATDDDWSLTMLGTQVLAGSADRIISCGIDSWRGGVHLTPKNDWRWVEGRLERRQR